MAFIIACASSKGGCGKSTLAVAIAGVYASNGTSVLLIDADARRRLEDEWFNAKTVSANIHVVSTRSDDLSKTVESYRDKYDVIIIDVEGSANWGLAEAIKAADFCLVPSNVSFQDLRDAQKVYDHVDSLNKESKRYRHCWIVWNRVPPAIRSKEMTATMEEAVQNGLPVLGTIHERDAYKAIFSYQSTLDKLREGNAVPSAAKAESEIARLITAMHDELEKKAA
ncbi:AAA family ATPase [Asticcacaulis sp. W401b]|uniref:AAA family ATPase n=1 Tax=Asticcacaulis sp. W401b TaxID=3388666 RepID=UPI0039710246